MAENQYKPLSLQNILDAEKFDSRLKEEDKTHRVLERLTCRKDGQKFWVDIRLKPSEYADYTLARQRGEPIDFSKYEIVDSNYSTIFPSQAE
jgi:hypothetical protein